MSGNICEERGKKGKRERGKKRVDGVHTNIDARSDAERTITITAKGIVSRGG